MRNNNLNAASAARSLINNKTHGILATQSITMPGYPFGSLTPYCIDYQGEIIILISRIAQHTRNIKHHAKVSLTVVNEETDIQASARVTYLGEAIAIDDEDTAERYYRHFPDARTYNGSHDFLTEEKKHQDFSFYRINLTRIRYIGGFGDIHWVDRDEYLLINPFSPLQEKSILEHMNEDHGSALIKYCQQNDIQVNQQPKMVGVDAEGMYIRHEQVVHFITFPEQVDTLQSLRKTVVKMAQNS